MQGTSGQKCTADTPSLQLPSNLVKTNLKSEIVCYSDDKRDNIFRPTKNSMVFSLIGSSLGWQLKFGMPETRNK